MGRQKWHRWIFTGINVIAITLVLYISSRFTQGPKQVAYSEFLTELRTGNLTEVQITEREMIGVLKSDSSHPKPIQELTIKATRLLGVDESRGLGTIGAGLLPVSLDNSESPSRLSASRFGLGGSFSFKNL